MDIFVAKVFQTNTSDSLDTRYFASAHLHPTLDLPTHPAASHHQDNF